MSIGRTAVGDRHYSSGVAQLAQMQEMDERPVSRYRGREHASQKFDNFVYWTAIIGLAWVPFWLGSNRELAWFINAAFFGALLLVFEVSLVARRRSHPVPVKRVALPVGAFFLVCIWILIQTSTWMPPQLHHPIYEWVREQLHVNISGSITINRAETYIALLRLLTAGSVFWLFLQLCRSPQRANWTVRTVAIIGLAYAVYGIVAFYVLPGTVLWFPKQAYLESVTSSFINRNSYATYAGIGLICAIGAALSDYVRQGTKVGQSVMRQAASLLVSTVGAGGWWLAAAFVIGMALALTGSRGGILAGLAGMIAFALLVLMRGRNGVAALALFLGCLLVGAAIFAFGDLLAARLSSQGFFDADRVAVYRLTLFSIFDAAWTGFGYGTFKNVFTLYRDSTVSPTGIWDKAHNTYLEMAQGLGIPIAAIFLCGLGVLAGRCAYAALIRQRSATAPLVATSATVIVALHSFVDFSMQIQAVALTWTALLGAGVAQSWSGRASEWLPRRSSG
jgi:O-antigen ligase